MRWHRLTPICVFTFIQSGPVIARNAGNQSFNCAVLRALDAEICDVAHLGVFPDPAPSVKFGWDWVGVIVGSCVHQGPVAEEIRIAHFGICAMFAGKSKRSVTLIESGF